MGMEVVIPHKCAEKRNAPPGLVIPANAGIQTPLQRRTAKKKKRLRHCERNPSILMLLHSAFCLSFAKNIMECMAATHA